MPPVTQYAKGQEGLIAYQVLGDGPRDLVYITGATGNVDVRWESPDFARFQERLASFSRLILFDRRGTGASDPVPIDALPSWEDWAEDLSVVLDAVGSEKAAVFAVLDAFSMAIPFAATHPERVSALILGNSTARWVAAPDYPQGVSAEMAETILGTVEGMWGTEEFASMTSPSLAADTGKRAWFAKLLRASATPRVAAAHLRSATQLDLRPILASIQVPTLVLHRKDFGMIPIAQGRYLADNIAGARFVELPGSDSSFAFANADAALAEIEEFLTGTRRSQTYDRVLATVLFTDLVDSTGLATRLGDQGWRRFLDQHDKIAREVTENHRGRLWKMTGDGVLATFDAPGRAIRCAVEIQAALSKEGVPVRAGIHSGEIELRSSDVGGIAVNLASRVCAKSNGGEVLVTRTVTDLVAGSGIRFVDRGPHQLKGITGDWQLFRVESVEA